MNETGRPQKKDHLLKITMPAQSHTRTHLPGRTCILGLLVVLVATAGLTPHSGARAQTGSRSFRALAVACDLPDGLRLTIDGQAIPTTYPTGKVTNLSAFQPGSYSIKAESTGCRALRQELAILPNTIHVWVFHTVPVAEVEELRDAGEPAAPDDGPPPTRILRLRDFTAPAKITRPATALVDLTGAGEGLSLLLDGKPVSLAPLQPKLFPARPPGTVLELAEPGHAGTPFFSRKIQPGNHAIVAIFRKRDGRLAAVMKIL